MKHAHFLLSSFITKISREFPLALVRLHLVCSLLVGMPPRGNNKWATAFGGNLESAQRCSKVLKGARRCSKVLKGAQRCSKVLKDAQRCSKVPKAAQRCSNALNCAQKRSKALNSAQNHQQRSKALKRFISLFRISCYPLGVRRLLEAPWPRKASLAGLARGPPSETSRICTGRTPNAAACVLVPQLSHARVSRACVYHVHFSRE